MRSITPPPTSLRAPIPQNDPVYDGWCSPDDPSTPVSGYYNRYMARPVFDRLTDAAYYSGTHRERFDEYGLGRGLAGREYVYYFDGMTESSQRKHEVVSTVERHHRPVTPTRRGLLSARDIQSKHGVQALTPKLIWIYRNGDAYHEGERYFVKAHIQSMKQLYRELTPLVRPFGACAVREIYDQRGRKILRLEELLDNGKYLACEGQGPTRNTTRLGKFLSEYVVWDS